MSSNPIIELFKDADLIKVTRTNGSYVNGRWLGEPPTEFDIEAAILPLGMSDMSTAVAAAGLETRDSIAIYTEFQLLEADQKAKIDRDMITWRGRNYMVKMVVPRYQIEELAHYKGVAVLKGS